MLFLKFFGCSIFISSQNLFIFFFSVMPSVLRKQEALWPSLVFLLYCCFWWCLLPCSIRYLSEAVIGHKIEWRRTSSVALGNYITPEMFCSPYWKSLLWEARTTLSFVLKFFLWSTFWEDPQKILSATSPWEHSLTQLPLKWPTPWTSRHFCQTSSRTLTGREHNPYKVRLGWSQSLMKTHKVAFFRWGKATPLLLLEFCRKGAWSYWKTTGFVRLFMDPLLKLLCKNQCV